MSGGLLLDRPVRRMVKNSSLAIGRWLILMPLPVLSHALIRSSTPFFSPPCVHSDQMLTLVSCFAAGAALPTVVPTAATAAIAPSTAAAILVRLLFNVPLSL